MEHNSFINLVEILKSQITHYTEIRDILASEKQAIISWDTNLMIELNKKKEQLSSKEMLLEEARKTISMRIKDEFNLADDTVLSIVDACPDEVIQDELTSLRDSLLVLVAEISQITASLKVLYTTNIKIITEIKSKMGFAPANKYGMEKSKVSMPTTLHVIG